MLIESFIASTLRSEKATAKVNKDASIHHYDFQPLQASKASFKKSSTNQNCLAVSASHIFAAQADKSVIHVYNRDRGNQEVVVPFHDRIRSIALAADADGAGVLVLGTEGGSVILWEVYLRKPALFQRLELTASSSFAPVVKFQRHHLTSIPPHLWRLTRHRISSCPDLQIRIYMCGRSRPCWHFPPRSTTMNQTSIINLAHFDPSRTIAPP